MQEYRWAIAFIAITFLLLAIADLHNSHVGTACTNAEGQVVVCADLQKPHVPPASRPDSAPAGVLPGTWFGTETAPLALVASLQAGSGGS